LPIAPQPARGSYHEAFYPVARTFARQLERGDEIGAALTVYHRGERVLHLYGGTADVERKIPWREDTRVLVFSVTKGLASMALALLADRGKLDYDAPVATYWPGFARAGKASITVRTLLNHRGGLLALDRDLTMDDVVNDARRDSLREALEAQRPLFTPEEDQGYHAITFGMYARELFERVAGEPMGRFLARELFEPLGADVSLGTGPEHDDRMARLYPITNGARLAKIAVARLSDPDTSEMRVLIESLRRGSITRRALLNPALGKAGIAAYDAVAVRRAELAWASATGTADGVARAYLPFASRGEFGGRRYLAEKTLAPVYRRQGWSERDRVLQKPVGWSQGFLKEERHLFSPEPASFGHAGLGGALGWCDPVRELTLGYVMNKLDWRVRSPRAVALCRALYECEPVRG
jgi:CubicO group peptidase (beta-lactamase class C family)